MELLGIRELFVGCGSDCPGVSLVFKMLETKRTIIVVHVKEFARAVVRWTFLPLLLLNEYYFL